MPRVLVYGATGYTGELVARRAVERGLDVLLAARDPAALGALAARLDRPSAAFPLEDAAALDAALRACDLVLHCAGPFSRTWRPVAAACLRTRRHYVDLTGEPAVIEALAALDGDARAAGIALLPAAGFDVAPSDTLAAHLVRRLPSATRLAVAMRGFGGISRGTARTLLESLSSAPALGGVRGLRGRLRSRAFDFGDGPREAAPLPSADVVAIRRSTGIRDVSFWMAAPRATRVGLALLAAVAPLAPALRVPAVREAAVRAMTGGRAGPTEDERARGRVDLVGVAEDDRGGRAVSRLRVPEGYRFTALAAVEIAERLLASPCAGHHTPASAFGPDLLLALPGVAREDVA